MKESKFFQKLQEIGLRVEHVPSTKGMTRRRPTSSQYSKECKYWDRFQSRNGSVWNLYRTYPTCDDIRDCGKPHIHTWSKPRQEWYSRCQQCTKKY